MTKNTVSAVEFTSDSGRTYALAMRGTKRNRIVVCTCPGFRRWERCKHAARALRDGMPANGTKIQVAPSALRITHKPTTTASTKENTVKKSSKPDTRTVTITQKPAPVPVVARSYNCGVCGQSGHNARSCATVAAPVVKSAKKVSKKITATEVVPVKKIKAMPTRSFDFPTEVPVNVKVQGERTMRKSVVLVPAAKDGFVQVRTGSRGRPALLDVSLIEKVRAI